MGNTKTELTECYWCGFTKQCSFTEIEQHDYPTNESWMADVPICKKCNYRGPEA